MFPLWRRKAQCRLSSVSKVRTRPPGRVRLVLEMLEGRQLPSTLMVTSNSDSGSGTLRAAITTANSQMGPTTIDFGIGSGAQTIALVSALPPIMKPVFLDGTTQPGYSGTPLVNIMGPTSSANTLTLLQGLDLDIASTGSTVQGLKVTGFQVGIDLVGNDNTVGGTTSGAGNFLSGNNIGISALGNNNTIGSTISGAGNVISGNNDQGVFVAGLDTVVEGNLIGTNANGTAALANGFEGITVQNPLGTTIGGTVPGARNVISGNGRNGILLENVVIQPGVGANAGTSSGSTADSQVAPLHDANVIQGNLIGVDVTGSLAIPNGANGVLVLGAFVGVTNNDNTIGGTGPGAGNVISGNMAYGILLDDTTGNEVIEANKIGTDKIGTLAVPNHLDGIYVSGSSNNTITGNLISGNGRFGIFLLGYPSSGPMVSSSNNVVQNNIIGLGQGAGGLANADDGVALFAGATNNTIGGTTPGTGNLISGNDRFGVYLNGSGTTGNLIQGNRIGTSVDATFNQGNILDGIAVFVGPSDNTIGGTASGAGNVISGNGRDGVYLGNAGSGNVLQGNFIGTSGDGSSVLPNGGTGVALQAVSATILGGTAGGAGNLIAGNLEGVVLIGAGTKGNLLQGNTIGSRPSVFNTFGVDIQGGASNNTVGGTTSGAGNTIAFDINGGVVIGNSPADATTVGNAILGNAIYSTQMGLGIDLGKDGLTLNGPGGAARSGPNDLQNYPVLNSATVRGTGAGNAVVIAFSFTSVASASFRLEFFLNNSSEPPQGHTFLGTFDVTTDASGNITSVTGGSVTGGVATITLTPPAGVNPSPGQLLTATATLTNNNGKPGSGTVGDTSEFSRPVTVVLSAT